MLEDAILYDQWMKKQELIDTSSIQNKPSFSSQKEDSSVEKFSWKKVGLSAFTKKRNSSRRVNKEHLSPNAREAFWRMTSSMCQCQDENYHELNAETTGDSSGVNGDSGVINSGGEVNVTDIENPRIEAKLKMGCMAAYCVLDKTNQTNMIPTRRNHDVIVEEKEDISRRLMTYQSLRRERNKNPSKYQTTCCRCDQFKFRTYYSPDCSW